MQERKIKVLLPTGIADAFDYKVPEGMAVEEGDFVKVPFGSREMLGIVWGEGGDEIEEAKLKSIKEKIPELKIGKGFSRFIKWVAAYTMSKPGAVLAMAIAGMKPETFNKKKEEEADEEIKCGEVELSEEQKETLQEIIKIIKENEFSVTLLDGVTGSGKTEVYFSVIGEVLFTPRSGFLTGSSAQALIMLPEIALTAQLIERVKKRFGFEPTLWHSGLTEKQRRTNWQRIISGEARLVIGARSALFLPYKNLKIIVADEEHDNSYKQEEGVIYHARDMAVVRGSIEKFSIILVSATPSLESMVNVETEKYKHVHLKDRFGEAVMPDIEVVDLKIDKNEQQKFISNRMRAAIKEVFERGEQSLIYLNRRGYAPLTICRTCGHRFQCPNCSAWLVEHKFKTEGEMKGKLQCHHCGYYAKIPEKCPSCSDEKSLVACGPGVERIEEEIKEFLPEAKPMVMASDTINDVKKLNKAVGEIERGEIDIIVGTQMVAKGHHFPKITLVGIVDADIGLSGGDLRATEKTYQLLHQVSGRAGREKLRGKVIVQSFMPENAVMEALLKGERDGFMQAEAETRKQNDMPPFGRLAAIIVSGKNEEKVKKFCRTMLMKAPQIQGLRLLGPAPAPITLLRGRYRYRFLLKSKKTFNIQEYIKAWLEQVKPPPSLRIKIDIDPYSFV